MTSAVYMLLGATLFVLGLLASVIHRSLLRRIIDVNVCGAGVFLLLVSLAYRGPDQAPDALLHALVLTGIVVAISATALALAIRRHLGLPGGAADQTAEQKSQQQREPQPERQIAEHSGAAR